MNAVEIEEAVSDLADQPFDAAEFPFAFLPPSATRKRPSSGCARARRTSPTCRRRSPAQQHPYRRVPQPARSAQTLTALRDEPDDRDGQSQVHPRDRRRDVRGRRPRQRRDRRLRLSRTSRTISVSSCRSPASPPSRQINDNPIDIRATGRLNKLYVELLKDNPDWGTEARGHDMNHFMARLIFCFFAEDTDIFQRRRPIHRHRRADERAATRPTPMR